MGIIVSIGYAALTDKDGLQYEKPETDFMIMRLLCCYLFHLSNYSDVASSFRRLKYLRYNPFAFEEKYRPQAFLICMYQFTSCFLCECVNLVFLTRQGSLIDLIMNYVAFEGISALDNLYVESIRNMVILEKHGAEEESMTESLLAFIKESDKDEKERITWNKMSITETVPKENATEEEREAGATEDKEQELSSPNGWRFLIVVYNIVRYMYKGVYFYMLPYMVVPISYYVYNSPRV